MCTCPCVYNLLEDIWSSLLAGAIFYFHKVLIQFIFIGFWIFFSFATFLCNSSGRCLHLTSNVRYSKLIAPLYFHGLLGAEKEALFHATFGSFWLWSIQGGAPLIQEAPGWLCGNRRQLTLHLSFPACLPKYLKGMRVGSIGLVSYLEVLKDLKKDKWQQSPQGISAEEWSQWNIPQAGESANLPALMNWMTQSPVYDCFPHICQHSGFTKRFSMISNSLTAALGVRKKQKLSQFLYYLYQTMFSVSKSSFSISNGAFFPFETLPCEVLRARSMPIVASESFNWLACLSDPLLLCASFQHQISVRQLEMGLEMCKLYCPLNKLVISW